MFDSLARFLNVGIAGSDVTPLRLLVVLILMSALVWTTRKGTQLFVNGVLTRRGVDVGLREALGAILRYGLLALGALGHPAGGRHRLDVVERAGGGDWCRPWLRPTGGHQQA